MRVLGAKGDTGLPGSSRAAQLCSKYLSRTRTWKQTNIDPYDVLFALPGAGGPQLNNAHSLFPQNFKSTEDLG